MNKIVCICIFSISTIYSSTGLTQDAANDLSKKDEYLPIVRVEPIYPTAAAARRIEGWVELSFTVLSSGRVSNVIVVDRHPKDTKVFDTPSIDAVSKWLYKPKVVDGKFVDTLGVTTKLQFSIISE